MTHRFNIEKMLLSVIGYKGTFYPGIFLNLPALIAKGGKFEVSPQSDQAKTHTATGTILRKQGVKQGCYYFMPVFLGGIEIPNAVISVTGKKTIVETPMVGRQGSVKELISIDDYEISIAAVIISEDGQYPEELVGEISKLWSRNESIELISALTDLVYGQNDKVVIKTIEFPPVGAIENAQVVKLTAVTDRPFELVIQ